LSDWIESYQKDAECVFGILKGKWCILKTGIRLAGTEVADRIWLTCCALHNMLLEVNGLDMQWRNGVASDWEGELGNNETEGFSTSAPFAIRHLQNPEIATFGSREHEQQCQQPRLMFGERRDNRDGDEMSEGSDGLPETLPNDRVWVQLQ
jgi:hypothetical protein